MLVSIASRGIRIRIGRDTIRLRSALGSNVCGGYMNGGTNRVGLWDESRFGLSSEAKGEMKNAGGRRIDVAIVGMPNAGKSQLLNAMIGTPIAAVSRKRHTTRSGIFGAKTVTNDGVDTQMVFVDTPGYLRSLRDDRFRIDPSSPHNNRRLSKEKQLLQSLTNVAKLELQNVDLTLLVIDSAKLFTDDVRETLAALMLHCCLTFLKETCTMEAHFQEQLNHDTANSTPTPTLPRCPFPLAIVLNKVDLVNPKSKLLTLATETTFMVDRAWTEAEQIMKEQMPNYKLDSPPLPSPSPPPPPLQNITDYDIEELPDIDPDREQCPVFMISALKDDGGINDMIHLLVDQAKALPPRPFAVEKDESTNMTPLERLEEVIREKIYRTVHREVPHQVHQVNKVFHYFHFTGTSSSQRGASQAHKPMQPRKGTHVPSLEKKKVLRIDQELLVQTKSHRRILCGKNNSILHRIENQACRTLEHIFDCTVDLELTVKVDKKRFLRAAADVDEDS